MYDFFAGREKVGGYHRGMSRSALLEAEPALAGNTRLKSGASYWDAQMNDARLTLENALDAAESGAIMVNHAEATSFDLRSDGEIHGVEVTDRLTGARRRVEARLFINASGPWGDLLLSQAGRRGKPMLGTSKGIHVIYGEKIVNHGLILRSRRDRRVFFVLPWQNLTLIGTTETPAPNDPGEAAPETEDVDYLLESASDALPGARIARSGIRSVFAGVRPLLASNKSILSNASREHAVTEGPGRLISVLGGKFTTFRSMASAAVDRIERRLGRSLSPCPTLDRPLPGAFQADVSAPGADAQLKERLRDFYGSRAEAVLRAAADLPDGLEPLCPHTWHVKAEVVHAMREEMAMSVEDVLERRLGLNPAAECRGMDAALKVARIAAAALGKDAAWAAESAGKYLEGISRPLSSELRIEKRRRP